MKKKVIIAACLVAISVLLISWGSTGHRLISGYAFLSFNEEMTQFSSWKSFLVDHSSDADSRKGSDPDEYPKHFIDIDNYPEFLTNGKINEDDSQLILEHSLNFVLENGILPWATLASYDSLTACFERRDWAKAKIFAADLGHYVADAHMPMHITKNYDGVLTGNNGIHYLYETSMLNTYAAEISYTGDSIKPIENVSNYIFSYLYKNYPYVDSVLLADTYARTVSSNTSSTAYKAALWSKTRRITILLFANASHRLSELFYSAWVRAGRPLISGGNYPTGVSRAFEIEVSILDQVFPNPVSNSVMIRFSLQKPSEISLDINDPLGRKLETLLKGYHKPGEFQCNWSVTSLPTGIYYLSLKTEDQLHVQRVLVGK